MALPSAAASFGREAPAVAATIACWWSERAAVDSAHRGGGVVRVDRGQVAGNPVPGELLVRVGRGLGQVRVGVGEGRVETRAASTDWFEEPTWITCLIGPP